METKHLEQISGELKVGLRQVVATAGLFDGGATVPFIARYRKEVTGGLDEVAILAIRDRLEQLVELDKRRDAILASLTEQGKLTDELNRAVLDAPTMAQLEDIYLPYRPKRRTRAMQAREKGLEPLAMRLLEQTAFDVVAAAAEFVSAEKSVEDAAAALAGARDIIAEIVNEAPAVRAAMRDLYESQAAYRAKVIPGKEADGIKFKDYYDWSEPAASAPSHRILAMRRGEAEGVLSLRVLPDDAPAVALLTGLYVKGDSAASGQVRQAVEDGYARLLSPSMETEIRLATRKRAENQAIHVFADNLRELLLSSPLGQKNVLALDPGFRTGCKVVCLDRQGKLIHDEVIFPHEPQRQLTESATRIMDLCRRFDIEAVAVGNGTAGRETEAFVRALPLPGEPIVVMVNESGASVYSASETARDEFPDQDVTVRGAVSIGRRLMDPLAELVKIDPKSIGVGQYQHDVDQGDLKKGLDDVVVSCVNSVGVELNTASKQLLRYVSGLGDVLAGNIVAFRDEHGPFANRHELLNVPRLGPKAFEQCAGFLRIRDGANPLDASAVHPESYSVVDRMAGDLGVSVHQLLREPETRQKINLETYVTPKTGLPTLTDILAELAKPGRDPRKQFEVFQFAEGVKTLSDLTPGLRLPGIVTNVAAFGAFVDVGVHQDGLVHVSQLADRFVKDPAEIVKVGQRVMVTVLEVDLERKRVSLTMRISQERPANPARENAPGPRGGSTAGPREKSQGPREGARTADEKPAPRQRPAATTSPITGPAADAKPAPRKDKDKTNQARTQRYDQPLNNNPFADFFKNYKPKQ
ncbi:MAG: RNA-binding transcriptional accessory protein [Phycisphaerae bacterium]|nr:RNA-binding transcriptional accessory protein [Phycisphaerae bacterium]